MFSIDDARHLLQAAKVFYDTCHEEDDEDPDEVPAQMLNLNDTFFWGTADGEIVPDEELPRVAELFRRYGDCGILFWVAERRKMQKAEFADVNRFLEFVRQEEGLIAREPSSSKRAYLQHSYLLGDDGQNRQIKKDTVIVVSGVKYRILEDTIAHGCPFVEVLSEQARWPVGFRFPMTLYLHIKGWATEESNACSEAKS